MDNRVSLGIMLAAAVIIAAFAVIYHENQSAPGLNTTGNSTSQYEAPVPINCSVGNVFLNFRNGTASRIFLADSSAMFGTFTEDRIDQYPPGMNYLEASIGDRFVSIDGTIRNDYAELLWIALDASIYDTKGNAIGTLLRSSGRPEFKAAWTGLASNESGAFHLLLKCDKQYTLKDIGRYEIVLAWEPTTIPPP